MIIDYISFPRNKKDCNSYCLNIFNRYNFRSCLNCFDCACMDSSTWSWIKQKYDNVDFSCRDGKAINSNLIAVDCLSNYDFILYKHFQTHVIDVLGRTDCNALFYMCCLCI